jgi:hypothetical protein
MMIKRGNCEDIQTSCLCIRRREGKRFFKACKTAINTKDYTLEEKKKGKPIDAGTLSHEKRQVATLGGKGPGRI